MRIFGKRAAEAARIQSKIAPYDRLEAPIVLTPDQLEILAISGGGAGGEAGPTTRGGAVQEPKQSLSERK